MLTVKLYVGGAEVGVREVSDAAAAARAAVELIEETGELQHGDKVTVVDLEEDPS